jgi:hypothetical protein
MQSGQEDAGGLPDGVGNDRAVSQFEIERGTDQFAKVASPSTFGSCTARTYCGGDCGLIGLGPGIKNLRAASAF